VKSKKIFNIIFPFAEVWLQSLPNNGPYNISTKWFELEESIVPIMLVMIPLLAMSSALHGFYNGYYLKALSILIFFYLFFSIVTWYLVKFRLEKPLSDSQLNFVKKVSMNSSLTLPTNKMVKKDMKPYFEAYFEIDRKSSFL